MIGYYSSLTIQFHISLGLRKEQLFYPGLMGNSQFSNSRVQSSTKIPRPSLHETANTTIPNIIREI